MSIEVCAGLNEIMQFGGKITLSTTEVSATGEFKSIPQAHYFTFLCIVSISWQLNHLVTNVFPFSSGNEDYRAITRDLNFSPTITRECVEISTFSDNTVEGTEVFFIRLTTAGVEVSSAIVFIGDTGEPIHH